MVEAAHRPTALYSEGLNPGAIMPPETPQSQIREVRQQVTYEYPLQKRIAEEWSHLLGEDFTVPTNVAVFRDKANQLFRMVGDQGLASRDDLLRKLAYVKIAAVSLATSMDADIASVVDEKLLEKMQAKYPPDAFTELRLKGHLVAEARAHLKTLYQNGQSYEFEGIPVPEEEQVARMPRREPFSDPFQDVADTWQRASMGRDLECHDCVGIVLGEADELLAEFEGVDVQNLDESKKVLILEEIADVVIAVDGKFSGEGECVSKWQNFALDRMIDTYGDVPKLRRMGVPTQIAMSYLSEYRKRDEKGLQPPVSPTPFYRGPYFRVETRAPLEASFSSGRIH